jgi:RHS repeat-associated protein
LGTVSADAVRAVPAQVATKIHYIFTDHLNTPWVITRATDNQMVWRWDQADPFGVAQPNENPAGLGVFKYNPRFPGQLFDAETGLYYNYHRHYDPRTGTYTQSDPIGLGGGLTRTPMSAGTRSTTPIPLGCSHRLYLGLNPSQLIVG